MLEGTLDACTQESVSGWCYDSSEPDRVVDVIVFVNERPVGTVAADLFRDDLLRAAKGNGRHGFVFDLSGHLDHSHETQTLSVKAAETEADLDGSPAVFRDGKRVALLCYYPWTTLFVNHSGIVHTCAPSSFLRDMDRSFVGDRRTQSLEEIWNGPAIRKYREAFLREDYGEFCRVDLCPFLNGVSIHSTSEEVLRAVAEKRTVLDFGPTHLVHDIDRGCNLHCTMCRAEVIPVNLSAVRDSINDIERVVRKGDLKSLHVSSAGEPLVFDDFVRFLATDTLSARNIEVSLNTNLTALTPAVWHRIKHNNLSLHISVDGTSRETYEKIRRGARWQTVVERMEFLSERLASGELRQVRLAYVITASNAHEVGEMVELTRRLGFQLVFFSQYGRLPSAEENIFEGCDLDKLDMAHDLLREAGAFEAPHVSLGSCGMLANRSYRSFGHRMNMAALQLTRYDDRQRATRIACTCLEDAAQGILEVEPAAWKAQEDLIADLGLSDSCHAVADQTGAANRGLFKANLSQESQR